MTYFETLYALAPDCCRLECNDDGTATWCVVGSLHYTEYTYTIEGSTICMAPKDTDSDSEEDCYESDPDTRTLKNEQSVVYYIQDAG